MQRRNHLGAFTDSRRDPLDRAGAHVADREYTAAAGLQQAVGAPLLSGEHKTFGIERNTGAGEPIGVRLRADEHEQMADFAPHVFARPAFAPADRLQYAVLTFKRG